MIDRTKEAFKINNDEGATKKILNDFRRGELGKYTLDDVYRKLE